MTGFCYGGQYPSASSLDIPTIHVLLDARNVDARRKAGHDALSREVRLGDPKDQFLVLSTSAPFLIQGIMSRSLAPTSSIGCAASLARVALNEVWLTLFSSIQSRANLPDWMSESTRFISFLVSSVTMRGPVTYSPYSAVLEIE